MTVSGNMIVNIEGGSPWGFRLQGGGNFPLQVIKIRKRSKSHRHLIEGDIIIRVNGIPVQGKTHEAVMDMVDATVGQCLNLEIYRGESLQKIPKKATVASPLAAVAPASQTSTRSSVQMSEHTQHHQKTEESVHQNRFSQQQMSQQSSSVLQQQQHQQQQQQQVTKSNLVLRNQVQPQQKVTQIQQSSQWQQSHSSHEQVTQQQMSVQQQQNSLQHQQMMSEHQQLAQQQFAEQQMARQQLAQQRQMTQQQTSSEQQSSQMMSSSSSSMFQQHESLQEEHTTNVSTAVWTSGQSTSLDDKQTDLVHHAYTSSPKPYKPKVASHLPLREPPFTPVKPSPPPASPAPATPTFADDKENLAPSPIPKPPVPAPNIPQFNVKNLKNLANQDWNEVDIEELDLPIPDYSKRMVIPPRPPEEETPLLEVVKKTIEIPDMTIRPAPPVAPKPKRVLAEVQPEPEPDIPDNVLIPIYTEDRPHLPVFGPPVVYGLNPALAPTGSASGVEEESIISETSSGSRKKKIYSDSSFYYDPSGVYPTIEEQIDLCKKISQSLTAAANSRARGATMFAKRQKRSAKWIHAGYSDGNVADLEDLCSELDPSEGGTKPLFQFRIPKVAHQISVESPTKMSLSREEFETLRLSQPKVDHTAINPNTCMNIVADLQTSKGRGAKLFAKRQARCDKYVVDEQTSVSAPTTPSEPPIPSISSPSVAMMNAQNRLADMITKPMPIIQPKVPPKPAPKPQLPDPPMKKNIGVPLPTVNADLQAEFKSVLDGPNFNRTAKGWKSVSFMPQPSN